MYAEMPVPNRFPLLGGLMVDDQGHLWVQDYSRPGADSIRWTVLGTGGQVLAHLNLPPDIRITDIREDYLLGVQRDELQLEYVVLLRLIRSGTGAGDGVP